jgi:ABC-type Fe3+/spermidine/putrescine transport system ATPase subunit
VLRDGRLEQVGTGPDLYERPGTLFVATFVGRGTVLRGVMRDPQHARVAEGAEWPVRCPTPLAPDAAVLLVVRPEALRFATDRGLAGTVQERRYLGGRALFQVGTEAGVLEVEAAVDAARPGDAVRVAAVFAHAFPAEPA